MEQPVSPDTQPEPERPRPTRPKVIYVMGAGRSGSTILGVTLGNCEGVFYAGELDKWLGRSGVSPLPGEQRARFWESVLGQVDAEDLFGGRTRTLERSSALFRARDYATRRRLRRRYRQVAASLYSAVAATAAATHVVDTSHYPLRAAQLQRLSEVDVLILFAVRDPQRVVSSFGRDDVPERRFGVLATNAYLWLTHALSMWVFLRHPRDRRLFVRHEDFLADPDGVIAQVLRWSGAGAPPRDLSALSTGMAFQGNRLIRTDVVALKGETPRSGRGSLLTALLQAPARVLLSRMAPAAARERQSSSIAS